MKRIFFQVLSALIMNLTSLNVGFMFAWPSSVILLFKSEDTPLHRPMAESEVALLGSLLFVGALVSTPCVGIFLDRLGRKNFAVLSAGAGMIGWALIAVTNRVELILLAVFMSGFSVSIFTIVPVFISEISDDSIRGCLTSGAMVLNGLGMLLSYLIGDLLSYKGMVHVFLSVSVVGVVLYSVVKESPMLLMKKGFEEEARKSIAFYKNCKLDSKIVLQEVLKIKRTLSPEIEGTEQQPPEEEKLTSEVQEKVPAERIGYFQFMKKSKSSQRALLVTVGLMSLGICQGMTVVIVYAKPMFTEVVPEDVMTPTWCCVLLAALNVASAFIAAYLTDLVGRRSLIISASLAAGICCIGLGTQIHIQWGPQWITALLIYLYCAAYMFGAGTVPYVLVSELFLPEVRSVNSMIVMEWTWVTNFVILFIFNPLVAAIGLGPVFYVFAVFCAGTAVFSVFFLPETKGLPIDVIQSLLVKSNTNYTASV